MKGEEDETEKDEKKKQSVWDKELLKVGRPFVDKDSPCMGQWLLGDSSRGDDTPEPEPDAVLLDRLRQSNQYKP